MVKTTNQIVFGVSIISQLMVVEIPLEKPMTHSFKRHLLALRSQAGIGKHNGSYQGTQLFTCPDGRGSFAKAMGSAQEFFGAQKFGVVQKRVNILYVLGFNYHELPLLSF